MSRKSRFSRSESSASLRRVSCDGVSALSDFRDLFGKVDAVSIAVPTPLHHRIGCALLEHGMVDRVVDRREMRRTIIRMLDFMMNDELDGR